RSHGDSADLLESFEREKLLTGSQARELRFGLEKTVTDPRAKIGSGRCNGAAGSNGAAGPNGSASLAVENDLPFDVTESRRGGDSLDGLTALGEYRILRRLGEGATGTVFLAYQEAEDRQVAIKVLAKDLAEKQPSLDRFYREAKSGALL